ncbi:MAG: 30S ribosomal protein S5, partial [Candidatus Fonsibacter ubiquis]|nr:30S ribosomal protein S5 [Candidatus Fonsibacter ubiquis]
AIRAICEMLGMQDIVAKSIGSSNPYNVVRACMFALSKQRSPKDISILRGKKISEVVARR